MGTKKLELNIVAIIVKTSDNRIVICQKQIIKGIHNVHFVGTCQKYCLENKPCLCYEEKQVRVFRLKGLCKGISRAKHPTASLVS